MSLTCVQTLETVGAGIVNEYGGNRPQLILVVLPANAAAVKQVVKLWGDTERMTPTQCVVRHNIWHLRRPRRT